MLLLCMLKEISTALLFSRSSRVFIDGIVLNQEPGVRGKIFFLRILSKGLYKKLLHAFLLVMNHVNVKGYWNRSIMEILSITSFFFVPYFTN